MSKIEVNQISSQCGSTLTIGQSGDTVTLASGATQTGFGRTGTVDWCTTAKTAPFTGVSGKGYFVNTSCGAVTVTLPATPTAGDIVSLSDYSGTWGTNNLTIGNNGSLINGACGCSILNTSKQSVTLIYVDGTKGWQSIQDSTNAVAGFSYITATGGTITTCGDYKIHTFTSDGTFCISVGSGPQAVVDYLIIAGGGAAGRDLGGGGGAGGYRESHTVPVSGCYTASPLASSTPLGPFFPGSYPVTVGGGGAGTPSPVCGSQVGANGSNSIFSTITSAGGGGGGATGGGGPVAGANGGSGGGGTASGFGTGNSPPVSPPQGNPGGSGAGTNPYYTGGGGGAGNAGEPGNTPNDGGPGGPGSASSITGSSVTRAGGGAAGAGYPGGAAGSPGPGGGGAGVPNYNGSPGGAGTANTGGGGGGGGDDTGGGSGGSGLVVIRYKFQ